MWGLWYWCMLKVLQYSKPRITDCHGWQWWGKGMVVSQSQVSFWKVCCWRGVHLSGPLLKIVSSHRVSGSCSVHRKQDTDWSKEYFTEHLVFMAHFWNLQWKYLLCYLGFLAEIRFITLPSLKAEKWAFLTQTQILITVLFHNIAH